MINVVIVSVVVLALVIFFMYDRFVREELDLKDEIILSLHRQLAEANKELEGVKSE